MPRVARVVVAQYPHHVYQRGHNRQPIFAEARDFETYIDTLRELKTRYEVAVNAYCLMTNHVHLLLAPRQTGALAKLMHGLAGSQARRHNDLEDRSGALWESRYKSSLVDHDEYLAAVCRYIELNPVRARIVAEPSDYRWSSCRERLGLEPPHLLDLGPWFLGLGSTDADRRHRYLNFLGAAIPPGEWQLIRESVQRGLLTGSDRFSEELARILGRRVERRGRGRPRKQGGSAEKNEPVPFSEK